MSTAMSRRRSLGLVGIAFCMGLLFQVGSAQAVGGFDSCDAEFDAFAGAINDLNWCTAVTPETGCIDEQIAYINAYQDLIDCFFAD